MSESLRLDRPPTLTQLAVDRIRNAIISGQFQPGQRLVEMELSESFGVSRAPLREAFRILAGEGLIEIRQNRGCLVINPTTDELAEMVLLRALLEGTAARLITARQDQAAIDRLAAIHQTMVSSRNMKNNLQFLDGFWAFHHGLVACADNRLLLQSWNTLRTMLRIFMSKTYSHFEDRREIINTLDGFLRCFRSGDAEMAERIVRSMFIWMGYTLLDTLIHPEIAGYITHLVGPGGSIVPIDPKALARRRAPAVAPSRDAADERPSRSKTGHAASLKRVI